MFGLKIPRFDKDVTSEERKQAFDEAVAYNVAKLGVSPEVSSKKKK